MMPFNSGEIPNRKPYRVVLDFSCVQYKWSGRQIANGDKLMGFGVGKVQNSPKAVDGKSVMASVKH